MQGHGKRRCGEIAPEGAVVHERKGEEDPGETGGAELSALEARHVDLWGYEFGESMAGSGAGIHGRLGGWSPW